MQGARAEGPPCSAGNKRTRASYADGGFSRLLILPRLWRSGLCLPDYASNQTEYGQDDALQGTQPGKQVHQENRQRTTANKAQCDAPMQDKKKERKYAVEIH